MAYLCGFLSKSLNLTAACLCKFYCVFEGVPIANLLSLNFSSLNATISHWAKRLSRQGHYEPITVVTEDTKYAEAVKYKENAAKLNALLDMDALKSDNATVRILPLHGGANTLTLSALNDLCRGCDDYATTAAFSSNGKRYYLIHTDEEFATQLFAAVQELWKKTKFVPPTPVPKKYVRKVDTSNACPSDCFIQLSGRCDEKGHVCTCDEVCVDSDCNRNCRSNCRCNGKCSDYACNYGMSQYH